MGHSSSRAALIYQHATRERDQKIAEGMGQLLVAAPTLSRVSSRRPGASVSDHLVRFAGDSWQEIEALPQSVRLTVQRAVF